MIGHNENTSGHTAQPTLDMAAGDAKDEQLKVNKDFLDQKAEEQAGTVHATAIDPSKVQIDNEIAVHFDSCNQLDVSNADPAYRYYWCGTAMRGWMVTYLLGIRIRSSASPYPEPIWEVVKGDMKESFENRDATGVRRVGDVILMRCRLDRYALFRRWERAQRLAAQDPNASASTALAALEEAHRRGVRGINLLVNDPMADPRYRRMAMQAAARGVAKDKFDALIREGKVPGFESGGPAFNAATAR